MPDSRLDQVAKRVTRQQATDFARYMFAADDKLRALLEEHKQMPGNPIIKLDIGERVIELVTAEVDRG